MLLITIKPWRSKCNLWQHRLLNFIYSRPPLLGPRNPVQYGMPPRVKSPRSSSPTHLPATDWNSTPTLLVVNMSSSRNPVYSSQNSTKSSMPPLTSRTTPIPGLYKPLIQEYAKGASVPIEFTSFQKYSE